MKTINFKPNNIFIFSILSLFVTGCSLTHNYDPKKFGGSVKSMVNSQIYDRSTIKNPPLDAVEGMDSNKAISDLRKVYRKSEGSKQQTKLITSPGKD